MWATPKQGPLRISSGNLGWNLWKRPPPNDLCKLKGSESRALEDHLIHYVEKVYLRDVKRGSTWKSIKLLDPAMPELTHLVFNYVNLNLCVPSLILTKTMAELLHTSYLNCQQVSPLLSYWKIRQLISRLISKVNFSKTLFPQSDCDDTPSLCSHSYFTLCHDYRSHNQMWLFRWQDPRVLHLHIPFAPRIIRYKADMQTQGRI